MRVYSPTEKATSCQLLLQSVHALLVASLQLCEEPNKVYEGVTWSCFIIEHTPMVRISHVDLSTLPSTDLISWTQFLRLDLRQQYPETCNAMMIFDTLASTFDKCGPEAHEALCAALPILATWETTAFVAGHQIADSVEFMLGLNGGMRTKALEGLGQLASVVLDRSVGRLNDGERH